MNHVPNRTEGCTTDAMDLVAERGHLEIVQFLHNRGNEEWTTDAMGMSAYHGYLDNVKILHENRTEQQMQWILLHEMIIFLCCCFSLSKQLQIYC